MRLLIVDDSLIVRNVIQRSVDDGKIESVFRAADGEEAVGLFEIHRPELVTMDLTMPKMDGLEAIRRIRVIEPKASILVISALNSHQTAFEALQRGACGFLTKPFTHHEVVEAIDELMIHAHNQEG